VVGWFFGGHCEILSGFGGSSSGKVVDGKRDRRSPEAGKCRSRKWEWKVEIRSPRERRWPKAGEGAWQKGKWKGSHVRTSYRKPTKEANGGVVECKGEEAIEGMG
jgi:hypothetical protein